MKTILISNRKGGTGKTTTAINLGAELAKNSRVLLIDFDTQGHSTIGLSQKSGKDFGSHSIFLGKSLSETLISTPLDNLTLSPALEFFDIYEYSNLRGVLENRFKKEHLNEFFDYCIIDTPPTYDSILKNSLEVADIIVIPFVPHILGVNAVEQMFRAIYQTSLGNKKRLPFITILPTMTNPHIKEHMEAIELIVKKFGKKRLFSPIGVDINLTNSFNSGIPTVLEEKRSRGKSDYQRFVKELLEKVKEAIDG